MTFINKTIIDVIKYPILTEKTLDLMQKEQYSFAVDPSATKASIKAAVEILFNVTVRSVNTSLQPTKKKRVGKFIGKKPQYKKAIVTLAPDNTISLFQKEEAE